MIGRVELAHVAAQPRVANGSSILYLENGGVWEDRHPRYQQYKKSSIQEVEKDGDATENVMGKICSLMICGSSHYLSL